MRPIRSCVKRYERLRARLDRFDRMRQTAGLPKATVKRLRKVPRGLLAYDLFCPRCCSKVHGSPEVKPFCTRCDQWKNVVLYSLRNDQTDRGLRTATGFAPDVDLASLQESMKAKSASSSTRKGARRGNTPT